MQEFFQQFTVIGVEGPKLIAAFLVATVLAIAIFFVYKFTFDGVMYSKNFNISLPVMCILTAMLILTISSSLVLSFGTLGALSIIRFRTSLKDPMDIIFLFWAASTGIVCGAGLYVVALIAFVIVTVSIIIFKKLIKQKEPFMLVLRLENAENENLIYDTIKAYANKYNIKSKATSKGVTELNIEIKANSKTVDLVNEVAKIEGVTTATMVTFNGEYAG